MNLLAGLTGEKLTAVNSETSSMAGDLAKAMTARRFASPVTPRCCCVGRIEPTGFETFAESSRCVQVNGDKSAWSGNAVTLSRIASTDLTRLVAEIGIKWFTSTVELTGSKMTPAAPSSRE